MREWRSSHAVNAYDAKNATIEIHATTIHAYGIELVAGNVTVRMVLLT
jgi:hypothetical protein